MEHFLNKQTHCDYFTKLTKAHKWLFKFLLEQTKLRMNLTCSKLFSLTKTDLLLLPKYHSKCACVIQWVSRGRIHHIPRSSFFGLVFMWIKNAMIMRLRALGIFTHISHINPSRLASCCSMTEPCSHIFS